MITVSSTQFVSCQQVLFNVARGLDTGDIERVCAQFSPAGVWHRKRQTLTGRTQIKQALTERSPSTVTRHLVTNIVVEAETAERLVVNCTTLTYRGEQEIPGTPVALDWPVSILDYQDIFELHDGQWLIASRQSTRVFNR